LTSEEHEQEKEEEEPKEVWKLTGVEVKVTGVEEDLLEEKDLLEEDFELPNELVSSP